MEQRSSSIPKASQPNWSPTRYFHGIASDIEESRRLQTVRGMVCILLVTYHVIGSENQTGLQVPSESIYRAFADFFVHVRMPLFTILSGFVYAYRPAVPGEMISLMIKKFRRLALPLITATTVVYLGHQAESLFNNATAQPNLWEVYVFSYEHFWFIQALLLTIALTLILEQLQALKTPRRYFICLGLAVIWFMRHPFDQILFFSLSGFDYLLPFFLFGVGLNRFRTTLMSPRALMLAVCVLVVSQWAFWSGMRSENGQSIDRHTLVAIAIGFSAALCCIRLVRPTSFLEKVGAYSFIIYLYHPIFPGIVRLAGKHIGIESISLLFFAGLVSGIFCSVLVEIVSRQFGLSTFMVLGRGDRTSAMVRLNPSTD